MRSKIRLDHAGIQAMLRGREVAGAVSDLAEEVADAVREAPEVVRHPEATVDVLDVVTDRAHSVVGIGHVIGRGLEAKYGTLTKAARAAGLSVTAYAPDDGGGE